MKSKGQVGMIGGIIAMVLGIIILVNIAFPQIRTMTNAQPGTDTALTEHFKNVTATTTTLANSDISTLSIAGLTVTANYTVNTATGVVTILNGTASGNYTAAYTYFAAGYIESTGTRAFAAVMILLIIVGLTMFIFSFFGLL